MNADLGKLLERLIHSGVDFILVGGLAAVIQGAPLATFDVDIVHDQSDKNITRLYSLLKSISARYRRPDDKVIEPKEDDLAGMGHFLFSTDLGPIDILSFIEGGKTYKDLLNHTVSITFRGHSIRVLDIKMMIDLKRMSNAPKDRQRLAVLEGTLKLLEDDS